MSVRIIHQTGFFWGKPKKTITIPGYQVKSGHGEWLKAISKDHVKYIVEERPDYWVLHPCGENGKIVEGPKVWIRKT